MLQCRSIICIIQYVNYWPPYIYKILYVSKSSVIISISTLSFKLSSLSDSGQLSLWSFSHSSLLLQSSFMSGKLTQPWHSQPGPQYDSFFLHPQLFDVQPFLQLQPLVRNWMLLLTFSWTSLSSQSNKYLLPSLIHPLCSGSGREEYISG